MKKVRIKSMQAPDKSSIVQEQKCFTILLGNGITLSYTTRKDMNFALAEINRQLNVFLFELNEMWIFCFSEYRRIWFYLIDDQCADERLIIELNGDIHRAFALVMERSTWVNGNVFSFKHLFTITGAIARELAIMAEVRRSKKQFIEFHLLEMKIKTVKRIADDLKSMRVDAKYSAAAKGINPLYTLPKGKQSQTAVR